MKKKRIVDVFVANKDTNELHVTSDGHVFYQEVHALNHSHDLTDKKVEKVTREEYSKEIEKAKAALVKTSEKEKTEGDQK